MKFIHRFFGAVTIVTLLLFLFVMPVLALGVLAQAPDPEPTAIDFLVKLLYGITITVPGFTALGVVLANLFKIPGWITDGNVQIFLNIFNVLAALVIVVLVSFFPDVDVPGLDVTLGKIAGTLTVLLPTFILLFKWLSPYFYRAIRGVPVIGYSHTLAADPKQNNLTQNASARPPVGAFSFDDLWTTPTVSPTTCWIRRKKKSTKRSGRRDWPRRTGLSWKCRIPS